MTKVVPYDVTGEKKLEFPASIGWCEKINQGKIQENTNLIRKNNLKIHDKRGRNQLKYSKPANFFEIGGLVLVRTNPISRKYYRRMKKLYLLYEGPYEIIAKKTENAYVLLSKRLKNRKIVINARRLRPYVRPTITATPDWETEESESDCETDEEVGSRHIQVKKTIVDCQSRREEKLVSISGLRVPIPKYSKME